MKKAYGLRGEVAVGGAVRGGEARGGERAAAAQRARRAGGPRNAFQFDAMDGMSIA